MKNRINRNTATPDEIAAHDAAVKARSREYQKKWRIENAERYYGMQRARRAAHPERTKLQSDKSRAKHKDKINQYQADRLRDFPEIVKAIRKKSYEKYKAVRHEKWAHDDAVRRGCLIGDRSLIIPLYEYAVKMQRETGVRWSVDHIIPLALGGAHDAANMQPMPLDLNHTKSGNPFWISVDGKYRDWRDVPKHLWSEKFITIFNCIVEYENSTHRWLAMTA